MTTASWWPLPAPWLLPGADTRSLPEGVLPEVQIWEIERGSGKLNRTGFCLRYFDRRVKDYRIVLYAKTDLKLDSMPPDFKKTHHLRAYYRWRKTAIEEGSIYEGDRVDFCLGFAIKAGVLTPNSCANAVAYPARTDRSEGRQLPEATYDSLLKMLNDNAVAKNTVLAKSFVVVMALTRSDFDVASPRIKSGLSLRPKQPRLPPKPMPWVGLACA